MKKGIFLIGIFAFMFMAVPNVGAMSTTHTISFDTLGGNPTTIDAQTKESGSSLDPVEDPTKEGYEFGGWYYIDETIPEPYNKVAFEGEVKAWMPENLTLYASWVQTVDALSFNIVLPVGTTLNGEELPDVNVTSANDTKYQAYPEGAGIITSFPSIMPSGYDTGFVGTVENGNSYYVELWVSPKAGYKFNPNATIKVNGTTDIEVGQYYQDADGKLNEYAQEGGFLLYAKVKAGTSSTSEYKIVSGNSQTFESGKDLVIKADGALDKLTGIKVDGTLIDSANYTTASGSTILTLKADYLSTLSAGNHTVTFVYTDGSVDAAFTIPNATGTTTATKTYANPNTGDNVFIYVILGAISVLGICVTRKKLKYNV